MSVIFIPGLYVECKNSSEEGKDGIPGLAEIHGSGEK
jgi:hypothetical protein